MSFVVWFFFIHNSTFFMRKKVNQEMGKK
jgi:hypothetical protein